MRIYTIGHGARSFDEFLATLSAAGVAGVVDVRRHPGSRRHPQFGREAFPVALARAGLAYDWLPALGGRREAAGGTSPNPAWRVDAFRHYADYMDTPPFAAGLGDLLAIAAARPSAAMCAETHWTQCHRRLIADKLATLGHDVVHLVAPDRQEPHVLPPFLRVEGALLRYDGGQSPTGSLFAAPPQSAGRRK